MNAPIRFGTDGWRAIIADQFTFDNVRRAARGVAAYALSQKKQPLIVVGYDTRFLSDRFARAAAETLAAGGCRVLLNDRPISTPAVSSAVVTNHAFGGVVISASHNPAAFNGFKFKTEHGSSAPEDVTQKLEEYIEHAAPLKRRPAGELKTVDATPSYFKRLSAMVDLPLIRKAPLTVVSDPMFGAAIGYLRLLLGSTKGTVREIHGAADPLFGGLHPEPIEHPLGDLKRAVRACHARAGLATDGDADRIGVVDDTGRYLTPHQVFPLLLHYLCHYKKMRGSVVQSLSLGYVSERIARDHALPFEEVPIGFKYIAARIMAQKPGAPVLIGGEESGGYGYGNYIPERDGVLNALMIMEMLAATGKKLSVLVKEIEKKYGASQYLRTDIPNPGIEKHEFVARTKNRVPAKIAGVKVVDVKDYDGVEFVMEDDSWLLLRPSGTEPIIRVYAESPSAQKTKSIISWGNKIVNALV